MHWYPVQSHFWGVSVQRKAEPYPTNQSFNLSFHWTAERNWDPKSGNIIMDLIANISPRCSWEHWSLDGSHSPDATQCPRLKPNLLLFLAVKYQLGLRAQDRFQPCTPHQHQ